MPKQKKISELNRLYTDAESADRSLFAEQRSNCLLAIGEHYNKKNSLFWSRIRDSSQLTDEQKLRLTKNHLHRICNIYVNNIFSQAPGVGIVPKNEKEIQDQKAAELHSSVWEDWKQRHDYRCGLRSRIEDFIKVGECAVKVFWDPNTGRFLGYEAKTDEFNQPIMDESNEMVSSGVPRFSGDIVLERIFAPNLLRDQKSQSMMDGCLIYRKMVDIKTLEGLYKGDEEKLSFIKPSSKDVYTVFDGANGDYRSTKDQVMIREYYEPSCYDYPNGYFWITTDIGILEEGEFPYGVHPILFTGMDDVPTSPRKRSIIKQLRPVVAELNRCASSIATTQISVGDDKLLVMSGTKVTQAGKLPGVRVLNYSGAPPTILSGRVGEQYFQYYGTTKAELYEIANVEEELQEKNVSTTDPFAELFKAIRHKKKFSMYAEKVSDFERKLCETVLTLAKGYYDENTLIPIIGRSEQVNIPEFKNSLPLSYEIKTLEQSDDYESKMGKQLTLNYALQYVGNKMDKDDIGRVLRVMPYTNKEEIFSDLTIDYDNATNDILLLDRGGMPDINEHDNHKYLIKKLTNRMKQSDFRLLPGNIQNNYNTFILAHEQLEALEQKKIQSAKDGFIPASGPLIAVDFYVSDPEKPSRTRRARLPYDAVDWLVKRLETQGINLKQLENLQQSALSGIASQMLQNPSQGMDMLPSAPPSGGIPPNMG